MEGTHLISSNNNEPPNKSSCRNILSSSAKTNVVSSSSTENSPIRLQNLSEPADDYEEELQAQTFSQPSSSSSLSFSSATSPTQHEKEKKSGRERLKRHREEVAGQVKIPDTWSQENFLMEWIDYSSFDKLLAPNGIASAREALMADGR
ncbi:hypothetical protein P3X46_000047 [Hevea brasiliensis]|uniref:Uncharacterized protein n=1 Tax=Hevea brasiliensis TaxID=3981 RepID=A0ABQ9NAP2_HEVBR|nr:protein BIC2-like [Hevea brasiliensis]KAJ9188676.1 hypothetical protein P3X46_000047 [Hevea brasiliensis]